MEAGTSAPKPEPWAPTLLACASLAGLAHSSSVSGKFLLTFLVFLLLLRRRVTYRLSQSALTRWLARLPFYSLILALAFADPLQLRGMWGVMHEFTGISLFEMYGELLAAELVVQAWRTRPAGGAIEPLVVILSPVILLLGSATNKPGLIPYLVPLYVTLLIPVLRGMRAREPEAPVRPAAGAPDQPARLVPRSVLAGALAAVLVLGCGSAEVLYANKHFLDMQFIALLRFLNPAGMEAQAGLPEQPQLGELSGMRGSTEQVLVLTGTVPEPHFRGWAFSSYDHGVWGPPLSGRKTIMLTRAKLQAETPGERCRVERVGGLSKTLLVPLNVAGVELPVEGVTGYHPGADLSFLSLLSPPYEYLLAPTARLPKEGALQQVEPFSEVDRQECLRVPAGLERVYKLAQEIAGSEPHAQAKIRAVEAYLQSHYPYSLRVPRMRGDPVTNFLFEFGPQTPGQAGGAHCEYFASAATLLLRSVGVPTRYVTGFLAHERLDKGHTVVRQRDGHAWAESYVEGAGWVPVDATPAAGLPSALNPPLSAWERWRDRVGAWQTEFVRWLREWSWAAFSLILAVLMVLGLAVRGLVWFWRRVRPPVAPVWSYSRPEQELAELARAFESFLSRRGVPCPRTRTWSEHLEATARAPVANTAPPPDWESLQAFAREYDAVRFDPLRDPAALARLRSRFQALR